MDFLFECGLDEAGRGPLAGPVVAGAVILPPDFPMEKSAPVVAVRATGHDRNSSGSKPSRTLLAFFDRLSSPLPGLLCYAPSGR